MNAYNQSLVWDRRFAPAPQLKRYAVMNIKLFLILVLLLMMANKLMAGEMICESIEKEGEGYWPIPESSFTRKNAIEELWKSRGQTR